MRKLRTRIVAGAAVAALAGGTAFAVTSLADGSTASPAADAASLAVTTAKTGTTLSIAASKAGITAGQVDVISGTLATGSAPAARRIVELYRYDAKTGKWIPVRVNLTHKGGLVRFRVRPRVTAEYEMVYHGSANLAGARSSTVTVTVTR